MKTGKAFYSSKIMLNIAEKAIKEDLTPEKIRQMYFKNNTKEFNDWYELYSDMISAKNHKDIAEAALLHNLYDKFIIEYQQMVADYKSLIDMHNAIQKQFNQSLDELNIPESAKVKIDLPLESINTELNRLLALDNFTEEDEAYSYILMYNKLLYANASRTDKWQQVDNIMAQYTTLKNELEAAIKSSDDNIIIAMLGIDFL